MSDRSGWRIMPAVPIALIMFAGCAPGPNPTPPAATTVAITAAPSATPTPTASAEAVTGDVITGLRAPWSIVFVGESALVSERDTARILEITSPGTSREVGLVPGVAAGGEAGLLGLAVDDQGRLYAYSTGAESNRIQRITLTGQPGSLGLGEIETVFDGIPKANFHDGGRIAFGPDGMLYVGTGDAGNRPAAQDRGSLAGKILRITPDGDIPADNPFPGSAVYSYGHRNVQGLAWAADGTLFASEFGQDTWDELNIITAGGNYGWPDVEGMGSNSEYINPVQQWKPADASPSGVAVLGDTLYIANLRGARLRAVPVADPATGSDYLVGEYGRLRTVVASPSGQLWVLTNNTSRGQTRDGDDRIVSLDPPG